MRGLLLWLGCALVNLHAASLTSVESAEVLKQAAAYQEAASKGDAEQLLEKTHPALHTLFGGKEPFEMATRAALKALAGKSVVSSCKFTAPSELFTSEAETLCFVPFVQMASAGEVRTRTESYYIAVRTPGRTTWRFISAAGLRKNPEVLAQLFPGLPKAVATPVNKVEILK